MSKKIAVAVLGATGMVGQKFISLLENHPWFEVTTVAASDRSIGRKYTKVAKWVLPNEIPPMVADLEVKTCEPGDVGDVVYVFSALPADIAGRIEENFARSGRLVFSNANSHRLDPDVPLLNPEVNADHMSLIEEQRRRRKWEGAIMANPNCTTAILTLSLKPICDEFGLDTVIVSSMQALSGAGYPGVASLDILDNVIPFIRNEEEKIQSEARKILGSIEKEANFKISASCNRVATSDGHIETVFVKTLTPAEPDVVAKTMMEFRGEPQKLKLPSAPASPIIVRHEEDRPQPRHDRMAGNGMSVVVGRIRKDLAIDGIKYVVLGHNTIRGAAGCSIINAELFRAKGIV